MKKAILTLGIIVAALIVLIGGCTVCSAVLDSMRYSSVEVVEEASEPEEEVLELKDLSDTEYLLMVLNYTDSCGADFVSMSDQLYKIATGESKITDLFWSMDTKEIAERIINSSNEIIDLDVSRVPEEFTDAHELLVSAAKDYRNAAGWTLKWMEDGSGYSLEQSTLSTESGNGYIEQCSEELESIAIQYEED